MTPTKADLIEVCIIFSRADQPITRIQLRTWLKERGHRWPQTRVDAALEWLMEREYVQRRQARGFCFTHKALRMTGFTWME